MLTVKRRRKQNDLSVEQESDIFHDALMDCSNGAEMKDNPYRPGSEAWIVWKKGWEYEAKEETL